MPKKTNKVETWTDANGLPIPIGRVTPLERLTEKHMKRIVKAAYAVEQALKVLKSDVRNSIVEIQAKQREGVTESKMTDSFTVFNFDKRQKIEVKAPDSIKFDKELLEQCKAKLYTFIDANVDEKKAWIKTMIMQAFATKSGKLDAVKVLDLLHYRGKVNDPVFNEALNLLEQATSRHKNKLYYIISVKNGDNEFKAIQLNFSTIE